MKKFLMPVALMTVALTLASCNNGPKSNSNSAPVAAFDISGSKAFKVIKLDAGTSTDPNGDLLTYHWSGGITASGKTVQTSFLAGTHTIKLTVTDPAGLSSTISKNLVVSPETASGQTTLTVKVVDLAGAALVGASVAINGQTASTDAQGMAQIASAPVGSTTLLTVGKTGYIQQSLQQDILVGTTDTTLKIALRPVGSSQTLDATAGGTVIASSGASVTFPPNVLVDEATGSPVTGTVNVQITPITQADAAFPGAGRAIDASGNTSTLMTYGMLDVVITKNNQKLQLAAGKTADLKLNLALNKHPDGTTIQVGDTIPTWWFNENSGVWIEEGQGKVVADSSSSSGKALTMTVNHFTGWNWDKFISGSNNTVIAVKCMYLNGSNSPTVPLITGQTCAINGYLTTLGSSTPISTFSNFVSPSGNLIYNIPAGMSITFTGTAGGYIGAAGTTTGQNTTLLNPLIIPLTTQLAPSPTPFSFTGTTYGPSYGPFKQVFLSFTGTGGATPTFTTTLGSAAPQALNSCVGLSGGGGYTVYPCRESLTATGVQIAFPNVSGQVFTLTGTASGSSASTTVTIP